MYTVSIYGPDAEAGPGALLEVAGFTSGVEALEYIAGHAGTGKRAELAAELASG